MFFQSTSSMTLSRPYKRIARPFNTPDGHYIGGVIDGCYLVDNDYAPDRTSAIRAYHAIEADLRRIFDYIEPHDDNLCTYSTRLYEIFLRAATEFESNCKAILEANGYARAGDWNMNDYKKIEKATLLSSYKVKLSIWSGGPKVLQPFAPWANGQPLSWYQDYNAVKHHRSIQFKKASLKNILESVSALFALLFAQFNIQAFSAHELVGMHHENDSWLSHHNTLLSVHLPDRWSEAQCYGFRNEDLPLLNPKFDKFNFSMTV
jgi:hypothetical protein